MKAVMNEAELYQRSNNLQKTDAIKCLKEYAFKIKWRNSRIKPRILDIGCGDGSVTADVLKPHIPLESRLDGCDISEKMVNFANAHHKDETTSFSVMDIAGELPEELIEAYDHVFSFYTVHWIRHQKRAFENIHQLLVPGGDCLLLFLGRMPMFDVYRIMAETSKWGRRLSDVEEYVPRYHDSQEPEKEIKDMMEEVGFRNIDVQCKNSVMYYDKIELLKNAVMAVNPFSIPRHLHDNFMEDYLDVVRDLRMTDEANNNLSDGLNIKASYSLIVVYASK